MSIFGLKLVDILIRIPAVLLALIVHEVSHGYMAMKLGDPTARNLGRLDLNPVKHLDPIGAICMLLFGFGWAKPVPINPRYFRKPKRDMALTALAGPLSNLIMAFVTMFVYYASLQIIFMMPSPVGFGQNLQEVWLTFVSVFISLNVGLAVFNLIPVPPLDGSRILLTILPPRLYFGIMRYERYIMLGLFALIYLNVLDFPLQWIGGKILDGMMFVVELIPWGFLDSLTFLTAL